MPIQLLKPDPLFANLPENPIFREFHAFQILKPPKEFELLACSQECRIQAITHRIGFFTLSNSTQNATTRSIPMAGWC
ncbi:MAG: hypothetical protein NZ602_04510 [Thermoguttaceae bacterium]|nr:hypothetical protein [Thermoguttaceae bacterium]MDW8036610.1 hypothetical protein [Thermoguttaceae bacterium]